LLRQSAESLAGRVSYVELTPLLAAEVPSDLGALQQLWLRGGMPMSWLAADAATSFQWRLDFIQTFLLRDMAQLGVRVPAETLRRFWTMLAHLQGQFFNASQLGQSLGGASHTTTARYLDTLVDAMVVRRLQPFLPNIGKRLVKSPKVYVRDSGLVHALLNIPDKETLLSHPVVGQSWECHVMENLLVCAGGRAQGYFYRTGGGAEIDLLLAWPDGSLWAVEIKRSLTPKLERGFHAACDDLQPARKYVVYPGRAAYPLSLDIEAIPVAELARLVAAA
jgi:predicted AAA+ superfamily ATPase